MNLTKRVFVLISTVRTAAYFFDHASNVQRSFRQGMLIFVTLDLKKCLFLVLLDLSLVFCSNFLKYKH